MALFTQLLQQPNQIISAVLEEDFYDIDIRTYKDLTYISLSRNAENLIYYEKAVTNRDILQYDYQFNGYGNFQFFSQLEDYPNYSQFGISVFFLYITKEEVESGF